MKVVFLHGFTQTATSWSRVLSALESEFDELVAVDLPGHGQNTNGRVDMCDIADELASLHGPAIFVGYSFGARIALHIACRHPDMVKGLVAISGSPGIADMEERTSRAHADDMLAQHIEVIGVEAFIDEWLANPLFKTLGPEQQMRSDRLRNSARGLADSLRHAGTGRQESLWDQLATINAPTLLVTGQLDTKFSDIAKDMSTALPNCQWISIAGAGHTVHLEKPDEVVQALNSWLKATFL